MTKLNIYKYILAFSAFLISGTAAFFSVYGISSLFAGSSISVSVMSGSLEIGKLVVASFLYRYWNDVSKVLKIYFLISTIVLVIITSSGIFGYLSNAYAKTSSNLKSIDSKISVLESKKQLIGNEKKRTENRITDISNIRNNQENRINNLYTSNQNSNAKRIEQSSGQLNGQIFNLNTKLDSLDNELSKIDNNILQEQSSISNSDVGPLKYIAVAFNTNIDTVVKFFILILIFVFDPLAISLIIAYNIVLRKEADELKTQKNTPIMSENSKIIETISSEINDMPNTDQISDNNINMPVEEQPLINMTVEEPKTVIEEQPITVAEDSVEPNNDIVLEPEVLEPKIKTSDDEYIKLLENGNSDHDFYHDVKKETPIPSWKSSNYKD